ncbi:hypothetical protein CKO44_06035 [Rubrivivax gelatinosus]|uniref:hypothetical protein n=1 Tax=Rubrivivax gelatinosus TaxID=28068 RepID=UPI001907AF8C|nr:hypothetical protein [Rubrivivax gelatinosus]MBK1613032.1 hypothetical protein [Rubrivivax gelatinosus]MBZ8142993.1 hypothetical protein [Rubrivivax gelatinosus]
MQDPVVMSEFARLDREGQLDEIKALLPQGGDNKVRFAGGAVLELATVIAFCEALSKIAGGVKGVGEMVEAAKKLVRWVVSLRDGGAEAPKPLSLRERALVLLFETKANRKAGLSDTKLKQILGCDEAELAEALAALLQAGVIRKSAAGEWKYAAGPV